jgi:hypothetical protein
MDPLQNPAFLAFAAISPLLIALLKQTGFSPQWNALVAFACYIAVGVCGALASGTPVTLDNAVALITVATLVGSAAYRLVWSKIGTGPDGTAPSLDEKITEATSVVKAAPQ